jgi:hypothetical protein
MSSTSTSMSLSSWGTCACASSGDLSCEICTHQIGDRQEGRKEGGERKKHSRNSHSDFDCHLLSVCASPSPSPVDAPTRTCALAPHTPSTAHDPPRRVPVRKAARVALAHRYTDPARAPCACTRTLRTNPTHCRRRSAAPIALVAPLPLLSGLSATHFHCAQKRPTQRAPAQGIALEWIYRDGAPSHLSLPRPRRSTRSRWPCRRRHRRRDAGRQPMPTPVPNEDAPPFPRSRSRSLGSGLALAYPYH